MVPPREFESLMGEGRDALRDDFFCKGVRLMASWRPRVSRFSRSEACGRTRTSAQSALVQTSLLHALLHSIIRGPVGFSRTEPLTCGFVVGDVGFEPTTSSV